MDPATDGNQGGGAGAGSPGAFSNEQLAALDTRWNNALNGFAKKMKGEMATMFKDILTEQLPTLTDQIAAQIIPTDEELAAYETEEAQRKAAEGGQPGQPGQPSPELTQLNAQLLEARKQNEQLNKRVLQIEQQSKDSEAKALKASQEAAVSAALNPFPFANDDYRDMSYQYFMGRVQRDAQGNFIVPGPDGPLPLKDAVEARMQNMSGMLAAKPVSGAGATSFAGTSRDPGPTLEGIKPGMDAGAKQQTAAAIAQFFQGGQ